MAVPYGREMLAPQVEQVVKVEQVEHAEEVEPAPEAQLPARPTQSTASMATEILGSTAPPPSNEPQEPTPLIISEDITLVSKNHRKRRLQLKRP